MRSNDRRKSSDARDSTFFYSGDIIKHGFLTKSPPAELFSKQIFFYPQSSWKKRYFLLIKLSRKSYSLQYYSSQNVKNQHKGEIRLDAVLSVRSGIENQDKMAAVQKMFKCSPEQVISISTKERVYYLIGDERDQIEEWLKAIQQAKEEARKDTETQTQTEDARRRTASLPVSSSSWEPVLSSARPNHKTEVTPVGASRPYSDPCHYPSSTKPTTSPLLRNSEYHRHSKPEESNQLFEVNDSPDEGIYDTPSKILRCIYCNNEDGVAPGPSSCPKCTHHLNKQSDDSEDDEENDEKEDQYVYMSSIPQLVENAISNVDHTARAPSSQDSLVSPVEWNPNTELGSPESTYDVITLSALGSDESSRCDGGHETEEKPLNQRRSIERRNCKKQRSTPSLRKLFISEDTSQFTEENISLPKEGLSTYLELTEVGERICVTQWKGPEHMTCPFHFGDHILAVNEIGIQSKEEFFRSISMARSEKVKITVVRVPNSDVLHAEGCRCPHCTTR